MGLFVQFGDDLRIHIYQKSNQWFSKPTEGHLLWPESDPCCSVGMILCNCAGSPSLTVLFTANGIPQAVCLPICQCWAASLSVTLPVCDAGRLPREPD